MFMCLSIFKEIIHRLAAARVLPLPTLAALRRVIPVPSDRTSSAASPMKAV